MARPVFLFLYYFDGAVSVYGGGGAFNSRKRGSFRVAHNDTRQRHVATACDADPLLQCESRGLRARGCTEVSDHDAVGFFPLTSMCVLAAD